jgi:ketosteroid isomerase-like protein
MRKDILQAGVSWPALVSLIIIIASVMIPRKLGAQNKPTVMEKNKQLIKKGFDRWTDGTASFFDLLSDDVTWTITGNSPISKTYTSRKQFLEEAIVPINDRLAQKIVPKLRELYADGDMVIALWDGKAIARDGVSYNNTYSWYMRVSGDKIIEVVAFFDTIDLAELWKRVPVGPDK